MEAGETVILPHGRGTLLATLRELWARRELFRAFVVRDLRVRYKQTAVGLLWVLLQPLAASGLLAFVVSRLRGDAPDRPIEFWLFFVAALVPWNAFAAAVQNATLSLEYNSTLIGRVYFPRVILPAAYIAGALSDAAIASLAVAGIALCVGAHVGAWLLFAPLMFGLLATTAFGVGAGLAALNAEYRDVKYALPFLLQIGMFLTVLLRLEDWPAVVRPFVGFNPLATAAECSRAALAGQAFPTLMFAESVCAATLILVVGLTIFNSRERRLADVL